ncbi:putative reverse transcriptase domain-containing protein [Tanacetum coccineum]
MSSSPHSTVVPSDSDNENTFSSTNILNYFPASPGNISPNSSDDFTKYLLDILLVPTVTEIRIYKQMCHFYHPHVIIALQFVPPRCLDFPRFLFLPKGDFITGKALDSFRSRFRSLMGIEMDGFSASRGRNTRASRRKDLDRACASHYEVSNLMEISVSESHVVSRNASCAGIVREPLFEERSVKTACSDRLMPPKRTSTSETPAITLDAIRQLVADSVATALKAQAANMANTDNTNKNTGTSGTPVARKGINDHKRKFEDRGNTTTNNNYPKHNNNNHSNNHINKNNYPDNHNKNNHNNDYHQQQHRRQETIRTYPTKKYHGNLPLCTRCTLHHTGVCTVKCQNCNKVGHMTRNYKSKGPAIRSNLLSVSVTCHACGEKWHYKSQCSSKTDNGTSHVSKKSLCDESLIIPKKEIWLDDKLNYMEESVEIMDREVKQLRRRCILIVKVRWNSKFTWEREDQIHAKYPYLFSNITQSLN